LDIFGHNGDSLGVDGAKVGVFEKTDQVALRSFLEGKDGRGLESQVSFEFLSNFSDQSLERELSDQKLSRFLVLSDFSEGDGSGSISVGLFNSTSVGGRLSGSFVRNLLSRGFSSSSSLLSRSLFGSGHLLNYLNLCPFPFNQSLFHTQILLAGS